jgi:hypothetical protein
LECLTLENSWISDQATDLVLVLRTHPKVAGPSEAAAPAGEPLFALDRLESTVP